MRFFSAKTRRRGYPPTLKLVRHERDPWWRGCTHFHEKVCGVCSLRLVYKYYWITFIMTIFWVLCRAKTFVRTSGVLCGGSIIGRPIWDYFSDTVHQMDQHSALSLCFASEKRCQLQVSTIIHEDLTTPPSKTHFSLQTHTLRHSRGGPTDLLDV